MLRGGVEYDSLALDRRGLDAYLGEIADVDSAALRTRPEREQMAFWINAYNALTLDLVLQNLNGPEGKGPRLKSIRDIPDAFSRPRRVVAGAQRSLDRIENEMLRARFRDPRIHFALVCAARSCPPLRPGAYTADSLDSELTVAARAFLADSTRNSFRIRGGAIRLSKLFDWYGQDFVDAAPLISAPAVKASRPAERALLTCLAPWLPPRAAAALAKARVRIEFLPYDWSLNDVPRRR